MNYELGPQIHYSPKIDDSGERQELSSSPENMRLDAGGLLIAGPSGTGKTSLARRLTEIFGINPQRNIKIGELFRALQAQPVLGYSDRPLALDQMLDNKVKDVIETGSKNDPFVLEARLTGVILGEMLDEGFAPDNKIIAILLVGDEAVRRERVHKREQEGNPNLTLKEATEKDKQREERDLAQWTVGHPQLKNVSPFDPELRNRNGQKVFDIVIDTTNLTIGGVEHELLTKLKELHAISEKTRDVLEKEEITGE